MKDTGERLIPGKRKWHFFVESLARYDFVVPYCASVRAKLVLDAGCGVGYGLFHLAKKGSNVIGIDLSKEAIEYARAHYRKGNVEFEVMDCTSLAFIDDTFDLICSFEVVEHVRNDREFLAEMRRVLRYGGFFIASTPNIDRPIFDRDPSKMSPFHVREYSLGEFTHLLLEYFEEVDMWGQRITNKEFLLHETRLATNPVRASKIIRCIPTNIRNLIPYEIKEKFLGSNPIKLTADDIEISRDNLRNSEHFVAVCKK